MGKGPVTCVHVIAIAQMQCTLSYLHVLNAMFHAQHSHMYLKHIAMSKRQGMYACQFVCCCTTVERVKSVYLCFCQQDWSNDANDT